ncbi:hypothetical protein [Streptomyces coffeae]|uniref:hypothetical protein n=1 Tax=Streptomyces coffeae TaxID=621382 RepID=UPI0027DD3B25|nr:hypothetical protein [Streptomyces coffeae]
MTACAFDAALAGGVSTRRREGSARGSARDGAARERFTVAADGSYGARLALEPETRCWYPERWTLDGPEPYAVPLPAAQPEEPDSELLPLADGQVLIHRRVAGHHAFSLLYPAGPGTGERLLGALDRADVSLLPPAPGGLSVFALARGERSTSVWLVHGGLVPQHLAEVPGRCTGGSWLDRTGRLLALDRELDGRTKTVVVDLRRGGETSPLLQITERSNDRLLLADPDSGLLLVRSDAPGDERLGWGVLGSTRPVRFPDCLRPAAQTEATPFAVQPGQVLTPEACAVAFRIDGPAGRPWVGVWRPAERQLRQFSAPEGWLPGAGLMTRDGELLLPYATRQVACGVARLWLPEPAERGHGVGLSRAGETRGGVELRGGLELPGASELRGAAEVPRRVEVGRTAEVTRPVQVPRTAELRRTAEMPRTGEIRRMAELRRPTELSGGGELPGGTALGRPTQLSHTAEVPRTGQSYRTGEMPGTEEARRTAELPHPGAMSGTAEPRTAEMMLHTGEIHLPVVAPRTRELPRTGAMGDPPGLSRTAEIPRLGEVPHTAGLPDSGELPSRGPVGRSDESARTGETRRTAELPRTGAMGDPAGLSRTGEIRGVAETPRAVEPPCAGELPRTAEIPRTAATSHTTQTLRGAEVAQGATIARGVGLPSAATPPTAARGVPRVVRRVAQTAPTEPAGIPAPARITPWTRVKGGDGAAVSGVEPWGGTGSWAGVEQTGPETEAEAGLGRGPVAGATVADATALAGAGSADALRPVPLQQAPLARPLQPRPPRWVRDQRPG